MYFAKSIDTNLRRCIVVMLGQLQHGATNCVNHIELEGIKLLLHANNVLITIFMDPIDVVAVEEWVPWLNSAES